MQLCNRKLVSSFFFPAFLCSPRLLLCLSWLVVGVILVTKDSSSPVTWMIWMVESTWRAIVTEREEIEGNRLCVSVCWDSYFVAATAASTATAIVPRDSGGDGGSWSDVARLSILLSF
uniref:Uncharacterized protein n=1 Tax=Anopheles aquasalis TaxID=42839 RepID=T1DQV7_ANOAQ